MFLAELLLQAQHLSQRILRYFPSLLQANTALQQQRHAAEACGVSPRPPGGSRLLSCVSVCRRRAGWFVHGNRNRTCQSLQPVDLHLSTRIVVWAPSCDRLNISVSSSRRRVDTMRTCLLICLVLLSGWCSVRGEWVCWIVLASCVIREERLTPTQSVLASSASYLST